MEDDHENYIAIELQADGSIAIGPLEWIIDADPLLAEAFLSETIDALTMIRDSLEPVGTKQ